MSTDVRTAVAAALDALALRPGRWFVAVSGGTDSIALLALLAELGPARGIEPIAAHVDHGIQPEAAAATEIVRRAAGALGVPLVTATLALGPGATETVARAARYRELERLRAEQGAHGVMTAHHADDQVETVLLRLVRGSGPAGLAAMSSAAAGVVRPLLQVRRRDLAAFVAGLGLAVWEDPSNRETRHLRNWIRGEVLPLLRHRLPDIDARLGDVANQARDLRLAWDELLDQLPGLDLNLEGAPSVAVEPWLAADGPVARQVLMALGRRVGCRIGSRAASRILRVVQHGVSGQAALAAGGWTAEYSFGRLVLHRGAAVAGTVAIEGASGALEWDGWRVRWQPGRAEVMDRRAFTTWLTEGPLEVGSPRPGDRLSPLGFEGRRPLVRLFQEARVASGERVRWPVFRREGRVVWVPGVSRSGEALPGPDSEAMEVHVTRVAARPDPPYASPA